MISGLLFTADYLTVGVRRAPRFAEAFASVEALRAELGAIFDAAPDPAGFNEAQTEDRIVRPVLDWLGWAGLRSVQTAVTAHDFPDYVLFPDHEAFATAAPLDDREKFRHAVAVADAKRWSLGLDQRGAGAGAGETPAAQVLRYMDRAATRSAQCRWGVLTNGRRWRLYHQGVPDRLGTWFEIDLAAALGRSPRQGELPLGGPLAGPSVDPFHALTLFRMFFGREGFGENARLALAEGRLYETRVRGDLSRTVFDVAYPGFLRALIAGDPARPAALTPEYLRQARDAALTLLYRLLFCFYAEDRDLLPSRNRSYADYSVRRLRQEAAERLDSDKTVSARFDRFWTELKALFAIIDEGEADLGVPPYNGGLFKPGTPAGALLVRAVISDRAILPLLDALSRRWSEPDGRKLWINYRDLSVRELGSIYERLLEYEPTADAGAADGVAIRLNPFARKGSGSYYTPDMLVRLIVKRTLGPLVRERKDAFEAAVADNADGRENADDRRARLDQADPATAILRLRVCDPAMGSGHFLVDLVSWLSEAVYTAMDGAEQAAAALNLGWRSPLAARLDALRHQIETEAAAHHWTLAPEQLSDANLIRRLVLKRCVYGVDKNPMAVELAKVALWLHTFTAGAPLSFLDHHLRCGDSLFGEWVDTAVRATDRKGQPNLSVGTAIQKALMSENAMRAIERLSDGVLAEAEESAKLYADVEAETAPLKGFLDVWHALRWLAPDAEDRRVVQAWLDGAYGDPARVAARLDAPIAPPELTREEGVIDLIAVEIAPEQMSLLPGQASGRDYVRLRRLLERAWALAGEQRFLHWQVAFPGVWRGWAAARTGGFDAVIGNPPWDRMKMQEVEWFAERAPAIARQPRAADRKAMIAALRASPFTLTVEEGAPATSTSAHPGASRGLEATGLNGEAPPERMERLGPGFRRDERTRKTEGREGAELVAAYDLARERAETAMRVARTSGDYPLLSRGDINLYSLFVERAQALLQPEGIAGLLTPSGIASDLTAAPFFRSLSGAGRVLTLFDFENRRGRDAAGANREPFFPDVDSRFKFCAFIAGAPQRTAAAAECAFFLQDEPGEGDARVFRMTADDFARVNPNTGTAPIFRSARDAEITRAIYARLPVLVDRSSGEEVKAWPVRYLRMFDMTNDSGLFWTDSKLSKSGAYLIGTAEWAKGPLRWAPLYEGKMVQAFNHRAADITVNLENLKRPAQQAEAELKNLTNPGWRPAFQFYVAEDKLPERLSYAIGLKHVTSSTNERSFIVAVVPECAAGNSLPLIVGESAWASAALVANGNALAFDYACRQKVHGNNLNWFLVEQLPVIPFAAYARRFGQRTAGEIVRDHVLRLSYTAHDLAAFARDMGHVYREGDGDIPDGKAPGDVRPPFVWDEDERRLLRARLDALYFILYGLTDRDDVRHVLSTFPIVRRKDEAAYGVYLTEALVLWYMNALEAGDDARDPPVAQLIAAAHRSRAA